MTTEPRMNDRQGVMAFKLGLAILSTLQDKGLLTDKEVTSILVAARRAADAQSASADQPGADMPVVDINME